MKSLFSFLCFLSLTGFYAQSIQDFSVPTGYIKVAEAKGDLDKGGRDEIILAFDTNIKASEQEGSSNRIDKLRMFYILKNENNHLKVWKENSTFLLSGGTGFSPEYNRLALSVKNNCLIIEQEYSTNSRHTQSYKHTFRFQEGDFYLIGSEDTFEDTCDFKFINVINFSTGKVVIDKEYSSCDEQTKVLPDGYKEFKHKFQALVKMNDFKIGEHTFRIPGSKEDFVF
ncbi:hypothetical protein CRN76_16320 [Chryseobacterium indologenes]|uniref:hypothetical protein n=1 Tax=Chryseobacterium indologenes TaxID=253 RepID=UPI000BFEA93A|nr:hypothetical protein [Chryseobacterium indologenes]ATN06862.1 hypothetical protein CRN76_16320 [Chryseobacterium indologenes]AYY84392.1 hypothetical protein EGX91_07475 [Chryseobacterium indologenes]QIX81346.1 hypothetical protein FOB56_08920 [Chryseobacterium indologenes]UDQ55095.1 hypothetical protein LJF28_05360 [Chryseobacterium indologenes]HAO29364.1 hypothetical protein [Chryseobacterium indologenes]